MANGFVFYRGPSMLDGRPIVAIVTGLEEASDNTKTGNILQTWIMRDDVAPHDACHTGDDASVCGDCPHRGVIEGGRNVKRSCYVTVFHAPLVVWKAFHRGVYPTGGTLPDGCTVRVGSYGDPAAVPLAAWQRLLRPAGACTGYTHQWRSCDPGYATFCMASCDSVEDFVQAKRLGWRTFRVKALSASKASKEVICPASEEAGFKTTCAACKACGGHGAKARADIVISVHGPQPKVNAFNMRLAA